MPDLLGIPLHKRKGGRHLSHSPLYTNYFQVTVYLLFGLFLGRLHLGNVKDGDFMAEYGFDKGEQE